MPSRICSIAGSCHRSSDDRETDRERRAAHEPIHRRDRSGHDEHAVHPVRRARRDRGALAQREHAQIYPQPGWVEHDAAEIWRNTQAVIEQVIAGGVRADGHRRRRHHESARDDGAVGPQHGAAAAQRVGVAGHADGRSRGRVRARRRSGPISCGDGPAAGDVFQRAQAASGCSTTCPARARRPRPATLLFGTIDTWLLWNLTGGPAGGVHLTDVTNASRTQLLDLETLDWDDGLLEAFTIPRTVLPRIGASSASYGAARHSPRCAVCRSPACSATSRRRSSDRPASSPARPRTRTAPAASCC